MTDRYPHEAAPYVLGALDPDERRAFEEHLAGCADCRAEVQGFAGLPGLLSRVPAGEIAEVLTTGPEPPHLMPALLSQVRRERRVRRWRAVTVGAVAAGVAALLAGVVVGIAGPGTDARPPVAGPSATGPSPTEPSPTGTSAAVFAFERMVDAPVSAEATLADVAGGTRIRMNCRYTGTIDGKERDYALRVVPMSGAPIQLATWPVLTGDDYWLGVVAPLPRDRIAAFEVTGASGRVLLRLAV